VPTPDFSLSRRQALKLGATGVAAASLPLPGAAAAVPAALAPAPAPAPEPLVLLDTYIAGTRYYQAERAEPLLRAGETLTLRREPTNPHDSRAIEVFSATGLKLGYVPRADNQPFARLMDAGRRITAKLIEVNGVRWDGLRMSLSLVG